MPDQAWSQFCRALEQAGQVILSDQAPDTPLDRAEGYRYLARLTREMLYSCLDNADPDFPRFHELDLVKIGADNPDNVYLSANIRGDRTYRITGTRGTIAYFSIGSKANRYAKDGTMASTGELSDADLVVAPDGTVEIIASAAPTGRQLAAARPGLDRSGGAPDVPRPDHRDARRWHIEQIDGPAEPAAAHARVPGESVAAGGVVGARHRGHVRALDRARSWRAPTSCPTSARRCSSGPVATRRSSTCTGTGRCGPARRG